jgi:hypothetical protein
MIILTRWSFLKGKREKMQEERIESILSYLNRKADEHYTGGVRMGFEDGRPASFVESTNPDHTAPKVPGNFNERDVIKKACRNKYFGTLFFIYEAGKITHFSYIQSWQGRVLEEMLYGAPSSLPARPPKRLAVTIKR